MFLDNKYSRTYQRLVDAARSRPLPDRSKADRKKAYHEEQYDVSRALGGEDSPDNYVYFTAKEHLVAHLLLPKMTHGAARAKMLSAPAKMLMVPKKIQGLRYIPTGRTFEIAKLAAAEAHRGNTEISAKISASRRGQKATAETRVILSAAQQAAWDDGRRVMTDEHKKAISDRHKGIQKSPETCAKLKQAWVARRARKAAGLEARAAYSDQTLQKFKNAAKLREQKKQQVVKIFAFGFIT